MKKLTILLFSILISFNSYGEWTKFLESDDRTFYIDAGSFKKHNDNVYWWEMQSSSKPLLHGIRSITTYKSGECGIFRFKIIVFNGYTNPMAKGDRETVDALPKWQYPEPETTDEFGLRAACSFAK